MSRRRPIALGALLAVAAAGYALAATGTARPDAYLPGVACAPPFRLVAVSGRVPPSVTVAYLVLGNGASLQTPTSHATYRFLLPAASVAAAGPVRLEYLDPAGHRHEKTVPHDASLAQCASRARQPPTSAGLSTPPNLSLHPPPPAARNGNLFATTRRPGENANTWALNLVNEATIHVQDTDPACSLNRLVPPLQPITLSQGAPDPQLLGLLGVLRRPPSSQELALGTKLPTMPTGALGVLTLFQRFSRIVHGPDGLVATITVGRGQVSLPASALPACQQKINRYLELLLRGEQPDVRFYAHEYRRYFKIGPLNLGVHPWLSFSFGTTAQAGGTGGPLDPRAFATHGTWGTAFLRQSPPGTSLVAGLVPDGVASVTLELPTHTARGRTSYPHPYAATTPVRDNVFFLAAVPRDPAVAAQRSAMTWRGPSGRIVRMIRNP